jgi:multiple sugar transport system substrate-binding protein
VALHLRVDTYGMFQFMSLSAPFVIGPDNRTLYWFDPETMKPLVDSPGHMRALKTLVDLVKLGPKEMLDWHALPWNHMMKSVCWR